MVPIYVTYKGDLRCEAAHGPSQTLIQTDAPKDNNGKGENFSPTDLLATALGSCILTVMGIAARAMNIDLGEAKATVQKEMVVAPIRRVGKLSVLVEIPIKLTKEQQEKLEHIAHTCPVHQSLHPDMSMPIEFRWA